MKEIYHETVFVCFCLVNDFYRSLCLAQISQAEIANDWKASTLNQPDQEYPQFNSQGYARFRILAPEARSLSKYIP